MARAGIGCVFFQTCPSLAIPIPDLLIIGSENSVANDPMVLLIIIPMKNGLFHWGYTPFSDIPNFKQLFNTRSRAPGHRGVRGTDQVPPSEKAVLREFSSGRRLNKPLPKVPTLK